MKIPIIGMIEPDSSDINTLWCTAFATNYRNAYHRPNIVEESITLANRTITDLLSYLEEQSVEI